MVEATRRAVAEETDRSTGTVGRLRRRVAQILAEDPDPPAMPAQRTFYRLVERLGLGQAHLRLGAHPPVAGQAARRPVRHGHRGPAR